MKQMVFKITSNINAWIKGFKKKVSSFKDKTLTTPKKVAEWGGKYARSIAPHDTGTLISSIAWKPLNRNKSKSNAIISIRPLKNPKYVGSRSSRGLTTRYALIHHKSGLGAQWMPKTGDPHFMFTTSKKVREKFGKDVKIHIQKFLKNR